jgi:hypothetical protein
MSFLNFFIFLYHSWTTGLLNKFIMASKLKKVNNLIKGFKHIKFNKLN